MRQAEQRQDEMTRKPKAYRVRWEYDDDARFEECNGEPRPLTAEEYASNEYMRDGKPIPYDEYLQYYGNPDRHVYLGCIVDTQCACCGSWNHAESMWHVDFMDDDRAYLAIEIGKAIPAMDGLNLPEYAGEIALNLLAEAGMPAAKREIAKRRKANERARAQQQADAR